MYIVTVTVFIKPEQIEAFKTATLDNAANTRKEPHNLRFDISQSEEDPARFLLYEAYKTKEDFAAHQKTAHYFRWRDTIKEMMAQSRQGAKFHSIFFDNTPQ